MAFARDSLLLKSRIKTVLDKHLYHKPNQIREEEKRNLIIRAALLRGDGIRGFSYKGENYWIKGEHVLGYYPRIPKDMIGAMREYTARWSVIFDEERPQVLSYISHILNQSDNPLEYLSHIPSGLREPMKLAYESLGIPMDGLDFRDITPPPEYQKAYNLLCARVTMNLLME